MPSMFWSVAIDGVVEPVGVGGRHGVQELGVLADRDVVLVDAVVVGDGAIQVARGRIVGIAGVADRHPVDRDGRGG